MTDDFEAKIRGVLSEHFGGGQWDGPHKSRFTPAAKKIAALVDPLARLADPSDKFAREVAQLKVPPGYPIDRVKAIARYLLTDGKQMDRDPLAEAAARGQRAELCNEFIGPILKDTREGYMSRMAEIAATELNPKKRTEKITALSIALKVLGNVENGLNGAIEAGKVAQQSLLKADRIERMGREDRRLLDIVPSF